MRSKSVEAKLRDPITAHLQQSFTRLNVRDTVAQALASLHHHPPGDEIVYFYVVDEDERLCGVVPTRRLLLSSPERLIADIMIDRILTIPHTATVLDACEFFALHRLLAFPVVNEKRRLLGIVDVNLYTAELGDMNQAGRNDDLFQLIGVHLTEAQQASPFTSFRMRFPWLMCNIAGGLAAALLGGLYQRELAWENAVLALFIPIVLALAESVSIQSVSLTLQSLRGRSPTWSALFNRAKAELVTGVLLGCVCALVVVAVVLMWIRQGLVLTCLLVGTAGGVACAAVIGFTMPYLLRLIRRDPQVAAGPIALAAADMLTLLIYFNLARLFIP